METRSTPGNVPLEQALYPFLTGSASTVKKTKAFPREQETLVNGLNEYRALRGARVSRLIPQLSAATITALTFEKGKRVTGVHVVRAKLRMNVTDRLASVLLVVQENSIFHADPRAGNLFYDRRRNELVILDWALTEHLTRKQRKDVVLLVLMMLLRDADGMAKAVQIDKLLDALPLTRLPGPMDAMRLLDKITLEGIRFPASFLMLQKASFTLGWVPVHLIALAGCVACV